MKRLWVSLCLLGAVVLLAACGTTVSSSVETIEGSGNIVTVEREVGGFSRIQINLGANLALTQGTGESLSIEADDNLMDYIQTEVRNGQLVVSTSDNISLTSSNPIQLNVEFTTLSGIEVNGSSIITGDNLDLETLRLTFSGSGSTRLNGSADEQAIIIRGEATIQNADLRSNNVTIEINGGGTVTVNAQEMLDVTVNGMGIIQYTGDPEITQEGSGAITISKMQ